jgi:hypothetical protein
MGTNKNKTPITFHLFNINLKCDLAPYPCSFHFMFKFSYVIEINFV